MAIVGIIISSISILLLLECNYTGGNKYNYDASAKSAGRMAKLAEEVYYNTHATYTSNLDALLAIDRNLTDDTNVTFIFDHASDRGFTLHTEHASGSGSTFVYHD